MVKRSKQSVQHKIPVYCKEFTFLQYFTSPVVVVMPITLFMHLNIAVFLWLSLLAYIINSDFMVCFWMLNVNLADVEYTVFCYSHDDLDALDPMANLPHSGMIELCLARQPYLVSTAYWLLVVLSISLTWSSHSHLFSTCRPDLHIL